MKFLNETHVVVDHDFHQFGEGGLSWVPSQFFFGFGGVAKQLLDLCRTEVFGIDLNEYAAGGFVDAFLVNSFALPFQLYADMVEGEGGKLAHGVIFAGGDDEVVGLRLL